MLTQTTLPIVRFGVLVAVLVGGFASNAFADKIKLTGHTDYRDGVGGEFNIKAYDLAGHDLLNDVLSDDYTTVNGTNPGDANGTRMNPGFSGLVGFQTFCIEYNEFIELNGIYEADISDGSIYGGVAGGVDPDGAGPLPKTDKISMGTAYLYTLFATGNLTGYNYTNGSGRESSAVSLQKAIWYLEDEISLTLSERNANIFLTGAIGALTEFGGIAAAKADNDFNLYHVRALNLWSATGQAKQDQLIMVRVPDGGATALFLGLALSGLAGFRRRSH